MFTIENYLLLGVISMHFLLNDEIPSLDEPSNCRALRVGYVWVWLGLCGFLIFHIHIHTNSIHLLDKF